MIYWIDQQKIDQLLVDAKDCKDEPVKVEILLLIYGVLCIRDALW